LPSRRALLLSLLICLASYAVIQHPWQARGGHGLQPTICVAIETSPRLRLGVVWTAPILSSLPPLMLAPAKACVEVPSLLAPNGTLPLPRELLIIP
jgi:hypothetical protein